MVYIVHPGCPYARPAPGEGARPASAGGGDLAFNAGACFRRIAAGALEASFRSAVEVRSEEELRAIEEMREIVSRNRLDRKDGLPRLIDPTALVVIDYRPGSPAGGQPPRPPSSRCGSWT